MEKYILLADSDERILSIEDTALKYFYGGQVVLAKTKTEAIEALKKHGRPEVIFIDFGLLIEEEGALHHFLEENGMHVPMVACSDSLEAQNDVKNWPLASALLAKPVSIEQFTYIVKGITTAPAATPSHVPVKVKTVLEFANGGFDFYLRLSKDNYVKIVKKDDLFTQEDSDKLISRGIYDVHIRASDSHDFLSVCEKNLSALFETRTQRGEHDLTLAVGALEQVESIAKAFGWSREAVMSAQKTVSAAISVLSKNSEISRTLKLRLSNPSSSYARHVGVFSYLVCALSTQLGWGGDSSQLKLVMAALLHDLAVEEEHYSDIKTWNKKASDLKDKSPETLKYRLHPLEASKLAQTLDVLPPDVDQIILQHHETMDGKGFPRGLTSSRIGHLSAFFIIVEDLVGFIGDGENLETSLKDFLTWGQAFYSEGNFKKIFELLNSNVADKFKE